MAEPRLSQEERKSRDKCGICCIPATSRGVLDCCNDIFCFSCIDTWSAFTNMCPLCKLNFKFITFVAVEEEEDTSDVETEGVLFDFLGQEREESWTSNNEDDGALSFPSYFIAEDAVVCLDGDRCLVRSGFPPDGEFGLEDTSVACDSCDCWYHASCVGYKADSQSEKAWICPRCLGTGALDLFKFQPSSSKFYASKSSSNNELIGKDGSITFVDEGETAVVVSMDASMYSVPSLQSTELASTSREREIGHMNAENRIASTSSLPLDTTVEKKSFSSMPTSATDYVSNEDKSTCHASREDVKITDVKDSSSALSSSTNCLDVPQTAIIHVENYCERRSFEAVSKELPRIVHDEALKANLAVNDTEKINILKKEYKKVKVEDNCDAQDISHVKKREASQNHEEHLESENKRQKSDHRYLAILHGQFTIGTALIYLREFEDICGCRQIETNSRSIVAVSSPKKAASKDDRIPKGRLIKDVIQSVSDAKQDVDQANINSINISFKEAFNPKSKVMDELKTLVQGLSPCHRRVILPRPNAKEGVNGKNDGTRTRKIIYRGSDLDKNASKLVDQMRQNLKENSGTSSDIGQINVTDEKFFTAFKAAILSSHASLRRQDAGMQRTKAHKLGSKLDGSRNSLMKKLYGGSGKRRQAWDRDWDISSWRERVSYEKKVKASSKDILQKEIAHIEETIRKSRKENKAELDSLQSRIYLADTSLLPRQSDIKPLSAQHEQKQPVQKTKVPGLTITTKPVTGSPQVDERSLSGSDQTSRIDKRQWALDILARKTKHEKCHNKMKGSLLEELPGHLRPILEYDRRSKVPTTSRQMQLDRFVEHYLQEQQPKALGENPECKAAIAAAVSKEKEIYDRSNSKGVYVNLCVQALSVAPKLIESLEPAPCSVSRTEELENLVVSEAWKAAGLISDSPPQSPISGNLPDIDNGPYALRESSSDKMEEGLEATYENQQDKDSELRSLNEERHLRDSEDSNGMNEEAPSGYKEEDNLEDINEEAPSNVLKDEKANTHPILEDISIANDERQVENIHKCSEMHSDTQDGFFTPVEHKESGEPHFGRTFSNSGWEHSFIDENIKTDEGAVDDAFQMERVRKQVEAYIKEHIRPLHRSHVITTDQYTWAVAKTTNKVMQHHLLATSASFLISEGEKVKKLAEQYLALYNDQRH